MSGGPSFWSTLGWKPKVSLAAGGATGVLALTLGTGLLLGGIAAGAATIVVWKTLHKKDAE